MKLFATPKSHFSRKVRLLLDHLELPYELVDVGNVAHGAISQFQGNPVMSVPVLEDGDQWMIESDHIASYLARSYGRDDRYAVLTESTDLLNARAVMNGIMANEVKLILSERTGLDPTHHAYFQKAKTSMIKSLEWLEQRAALLNADQAAYLDFHFISMWDHLNTYGLLPLPYPQLEKAAVALGSSQRIRMSAPPG